MATQSTVQSGTKQSFQAAAQQYGVKAGYSGNVKKMLVSGDDAKVKSFIRVQCLKGKNFYPFSFGQGN
jgi:hypothetical protein